MHHEYGDPYDASFFILLDPTTKEGEIQACVSRGSESPLKTLRELIEKLPGVALHWERRNKQGEVTKKCKT